MTRINLVPAHMLSDEHLKGEYHEITRIFTLVKKHLDKGKTKEDLNIPENFTLGTGHNRFFYDKLEWLLARYRELNLSMKLRGYYPSVALYKKVSSDALQFSKDAKLFNDWSPKPEDYYLSMARLCKAFNYTTVHIELEK